MRLVKDVNSSNDHFVGEVSVHPSVCYDFVVSLRALLNPRTYKQSRRWAAEQLPRYDASLRDKAKFFFEGQDTSLGYGAMRLIADLAEDADPQDLIDAVMASDPGELAIYMLDTGETSDSQLELYRRVLTGEARPADSVGDLPEGWSARAQRVLASPEEAQKDLVEVLQFHLASSFAEHARDLSPLIEAATTKAQELARILPAGAAIEHLAGGYTLSPDLEIDRVILAPSVFVYPYMSTRVNVETREALVIFGVPNQLFTDYEPVPVRDDLLAALKAMSDPNRLSILRLVADQPMYTSELVTTLKLGQPTVHHHLHQLRTAGLVRQERDRKGMRYSIRQDTAAEVLRSLHSWLLGTDEDAPAAKPDSV